MTFHSLLQGQILVPMNGDTVIFISPSNSYTVLDPGGYANYPGPCDGTLTLKSTNGRPFVISGNYGIDEGHWLTVYQGENKNYPVEDYYSGNGSIKILCYSGAVTLHFYSDPFSSNQGFSFQICFPNIYNVHASGTNSTYTNLNWQGPNYRYWVDYFQTLDGSRSTTTHYIGQSFTDSLHTLASGTQYSYYIRYSNSFYHESSISDTAEYCQPEYHFRTPKVQDCNSCNHYRQCIDYTSLTGADQVVCYKGNTNRPDSAICVVDNGWEAASSQHTVNRTIGAMDPRTSGGLRIIPEGDTSSVRLGNWTSGGGGESILYEIHVDTNDYDLMMLRYAVVFQQPNGMGRQLPRFTIRLTDQNCIPIMPLCYCRDIIYDQTDPAWHTVSSGTSLPYKWHDWMAIGIDLSEFHGKTLYLQLSTHDGTLSGAAYAYFTLHCGRKQIDHLQLCGNNTSNTFFAPQGFDYRWFDATNPDSTLSTCDSLHVEDAGLYQCQVSARDCPDSTCGYIINALASSRYAHASFQYSASAAHCQFNVRFVNRSYVTDSNGIQLWTREDCETAYWDFGNGQTSDSYNAEVTYTAAGDYIVMLIAGIAGNSCMDTLIDTIHLEWEYATPFIDGVNAVCPGQPVTLTMHNATECTWTYLGYNRTAFSLPINSVYNSATVTCQVTDSNECRYNFNYPIIVWPAYIQDPPTTICEAQLPYTWRGHTYYEYTTTGVYDYYESSIHGCDSIVHHHLTVLPTYNRYETRMYCDYITTFPYADTVYDTLGQHTYVFHLNTGCDSIVHLTLAAMTVSRDTIRAEVCRGYAYDTTGFHLTAAETGTVGRIVRTIRPHAYNIPCDSIVTLILDVRPQTTSTVNYIINENELPFHFNGVDLYNNIDTVFIIPNQYGCDSSIHLTLFINRNTTTVLRRTICADSLPYHWDGLVYDSAGIQSITHLRSNGADSIVLHILTVNPVYSHLTTDTICDNQSIAFCGTNYSLAGLYTHNLHSVATCDSVEQLQLTVFPTHAVNTYDTSCSDVTYIFAGIPRPTSGIYSHTFLNSYGCDSLVTINLTVNPVTARNYYDTVLENNLPRIFNGRQFYSDINDSLVIISNHYGCDSVIRYWLKVQWNGHSVEDSTVCENMLPLVWDGTLFNGLVPQQPNGSRTEQISDTLTGISGADSIVLRRLHINPTYSHTIIDTICDDATYTFCGLTYSANGTYTHSLTSVNNCDSVVTLHLTVNAVTFSVYDTTIVENWLPSYSFNGLHFNGPVSNQTVTILNVSGCDSVIDFTLHVTPNVSTMDYDTVCQSALPLTWNGQLFTSAGVKTAVLHTTGGSDSVVTMNLYVHPIYNHTFPRTICDNESTTFNEVTYTTAQSHTDTLQTVEGCDSVTTLVLTVNPTHATEFYDTVCNNQTYTFAGIVRDSTADYLHTFDNRYLCDSVVTLHLTVNAVTFSVYDTTIVENWLPSYSFNGLHFNGPVSNQTVTITNVSGCDSVIDFTLHVTPNVSTMDYDTVCQSALPLTWNGQLFTSAGVKTAVLHTTGGSDSVVTMNLYVYPTYSHTFPRTICDNESTTFNGVTYTTAQSHTDTLQTAEGCDSVVTLSLTVNPTHATEFYDTVCNNQIYTFAGIVRDSTADYLHTFNNTYLCDSVVTLHLTVNPVTYGTTYDTIVENQLPHTFNGVTYTRPMFENSDATLRPELSDTITIVNHYGCDSVIHYHLFIHWNERTYADSTICQSQLPLIWDGTDFTADDYDFFNSVYSKTKIDTLLNIALADSIVYRTLHINPIYSHILPDTICNDTSYYYNGNTYTTTGSYPNTLQTMHGCDSVVTLNLVVHPVTYSDVADTVIENNLPHLYQGNTFDASRFYDDNGLRSSTYDTTVIITNHFGCDSIVSYSIVARWNVYDTIDSTVCVDRLPLQWNHREFGIATPTQPTEPTTIQQNDTLLAWTGADSILTMRLRVNPTHSVDYFDTICNNQTTTFNDSIYNLPGSYPHLFGNRWGCDSLETLRLTVFGTSAATVADTIVENNLPFLFNGLLFTDTLLGTTHNVTPRFAAIDSTIIIRNHYGCDSTIHYTLCVHWNVTASADSTICENRLPLQWNHRTFNSNNLTLSNILVLSDTLLAWTGSDSLLTMSVTVDTNTHSSVCDTVVENQLPHTYEGCTFGFSDFPDYGTSGLRSSTYDTTIIISNAKGCDSVVNYRLKVWWNPTTHLDSTVCENQLPLVWQGALFYLPSPLPQNMFTITDTVVYTAQHGEDSLVVLHLHVNVNSSSLIGDTIVENQMPFAWNGITFTWNDTVNVTTRYADLQHSTILANVAGCDSNTTMQLFVWLNRQADADSSVCENYFPYVWNGLTFTGTSTQQYYTTTTHGADSTLTMNITQLFNTYSVWADTIVEESLAYNFNGYSFSTALFSDTASWSEDSMVYRPHFSWIDTIVTIPNSDGCDSLINYRLNVHWNVHVTLDSTVCADMLPLQWNARVYTDSIVQASPLSGLQHTAILLDTLPASNGADSIITMRLHVNPIYHIDILDTVCADNFTIFYGDTIRETGQYTMHFTTTDGCDSNEYLNFSHFPDYDLTYYDTICDYSGVMRIDVEYIGISHMHTVNGCDSNEVYHLWAYPVDYVSIDSIISDHLLPFSYNGLTFNDTTGGQALVTLVNRYGCDSIINFTLTVMPTERVTVDSTICESLLPLLWDSTLFEHTACLSADSTITLTIIDTLHTRYGADSIVTRNLHVNPEFAIAYIDTTCNGAPYPFGDSLYTASGTYTHQYLTVSQCDSVETLQLTVNAMSYASVSETIVQNQLPYSFGGVTFNSLAGVTDTIITILNTAACDSVITYTLHVLPNSYVRRDTVVCFDQLPLSWDGLTFNPPSPAITSSQLLFDSTVVLMPNGTDSVARHFVLVYPVFNHTDTIRTCDSYTWIDGNTYTDNTVVTGLILTTVDGCDSVKNLALTIDHATTTIDSILSCGPYMWQDSTTYSSSISGPTHLLQTIHGCDSNVVLELTVAWAAATDLYDTICEGLNYPFGGNEYEVTGDYDDSLRTNMGCDSIVTLHLHVLVPPPVQIIVSNYDCVTRTYYLHVQTDAPFFEWNSFPEDLTITGSLHNRDLQVRPKTHELYMLIADYKDVPTCPNSDSIYLSPLLQPHAAIEYSPEFLTVDQPHLSLINRSTNEENHRWWVNGDDYGSDTRISYFANITELPSDLDSISVMLIADAAEGKCYDTALALIPFRKATIWAPNVFTPDENNNNVFYIRYLGITDYRIDLYTRGGTLVWHSENMDDTWDGTYHGKKCPQDAYVWIIHYRDVTAPQNLLSKKGTVTLLR